MAIAYRTLEPSQTNPPSLFQLTGVSWQTYQALIAEVPGFIAQSQAIGQRATVRLFRQHIREILSD